MKNLLSFVLRVFSGMGRHVKLVDAAIQAVQNAKNGMDAVTDIPEDEREKIRVVFPVIAFITKITDEQAMQGLSRLEKNLLFLRSAMMIFRSLEAQYGPNDTRLILLIQSRYAKLFGK